MLKRFYLTKCPTHRSDLNFLNKLQLLYKIEFFENLRTAAPDLLKIKLVAWLRIEFLAYSEPIL